LESLGFGERILEYGERGDSPKGATGAERSTSLIKALTFECEEAPRAAEVRVDLVLRALLNGGVGGHEEEEGDDAGGGLPAGASVHVIGREEVTEGRIIYGIALTVCAPPA
jgi:hypothetical protein